MLFAVLAETIAVSWIYGTDRFCADIKDMIGFKPGIYWRVCWKFVAPLFLMIQKLYKIVQEVSVSFKKEFTLLTIFIKKHIFISYNRDNNIYNNYNKFISFLIILWIELVTLSRLLPLFQFLF